MQIAILGGTGGIGGHVLDWALQAGYPVHALARSPQALAPAPGSTGSARTTRRPAGGRSPGPTWPGLSRLR